MNKLFGRKYLITVLVLSLLAVLVLVSFLYLDKIINLTPFSIPALKSWQGENATE